MFKDTNKIAVSNLKHYSWRVHSYGVSEREIEDVIDVPER